MSAAVHASYRASLDLEENSVCGNVEARVRIENNQDERFKQIHDETLAVDREAFFQVQKNKDADTKATKWKGITPKAKSALIEMICQVSNENLEITLHGDVADLLLTSEGKVNFKNQVIVLRMIDMVPNEWTSKEIILENLREYCQVVRNDMSDVGSKEIRQIEKNWSHKLCSVLANLGKTHTTSNSMVLHTLAKFAKSKNSTNYTVGSSLVKRQVKNCYEVRNKDLIETENTKIMNPKEYMDNLKKRISTANIARKATTGVPTQKAGCGLRFDLGSPNSHADLDVATDDGSNKLIKRKITGIEALSKPSSGGTSLKSDGNLTIDDKENCLEVREFEVEVKELDLPESPFKTRVKIGGIVQDSNAHIEVSSIHKVSKEVKTDGRGRIKFDNPMKRNVLYLYATLADNPLVRERKEMIKQTQWIRDNCTIDVDGDQVSLLQIATTKSTLGDILYRRGKYQDEKGLAYSIFEVLLFSSKNRS